MKLRDPSLLPNGPKRFVSYWLRDVVAGFDARGWISLIPLHFLACAAVGVFVGRFADPKLWTEMANGIAFYAAGLAVNAILLAVCWACFARIFETLGDPAFGAWMKHRQLDAYYGFYVDFIQLTQMAAMATMGVGLLAVLLSNFPIWLDRVCLGAAITLSAYAGYWTSGGVRVMRELADLRSQFLDTPGSVQNLHGSKAAI